MSMGHRKTLSNARHWALMISALRKGVQNSSSSAPLRRVSTKNRQAWNATSVLSRKAQILAANKSRSGGITQNRLTQTTTAQPSTIIQTAERRKGMRPTKRIIGSKVSSESGLPARVRLDRFGRRTAAFKSGSLSRQE